MCLGVCVCVCVCVCVRGCVGAYARACHVTSVACVFEEAGGGVVGTCVDF